MIANSYSNFDVCSATCCSAVFERNEGESLIALPSSLPLQHTPARQLRVVDPLTPLRGGYMRNHHDHLTQWAPRLMLALKQQLSAVVPGAPPSRTVGAWLCRLVKAHLLAAR